MFDIKALEIIDGSAHHVTDASGEEQFADEAKTIPILIRVCSPGTAKAMRAVHTRDEKNSDNVVNRMAGRKNKRQAEDGLRERAEFLAAITEGFENFDYDGKSGYEAYKALYMNPKLGHIADGVEKFFNDRGNFKADSQTTLSVTSVK